MSVLGEGRSRTSVNGHCKMRMMEWGKLTFHHAHTQMNAPFTRDRDKSSYVLMLSNFFLDMNDVRTLDCSTSTYCLPSALYDRHSIVSCSKKRRGAGRFEVKHRSADVNEYFIGWYNTAYFHGIAWQMSLALCKHLVNKVRAILRSAGSHVSSTCVCFAQNQCRLLRL